MRSPEPCRQAPPLRERRTRHHDAVRGDNATRTRNASLTIVAQRPTPGTQRKRPRIDRSLDDSQARVTLGGVPDHPGVAASLFEQVAAKGIFVDMIVQSYARGGRATISFTVPRDTLTESVALVEQLSHSLGCGPVSHSPHAGKLSVTGIGMRSHAEVAIRMFRALSEQQINIGMVSTSEVRVNVVVDGEHGPRGMKALQQAFADALA